MLSKINYTSIAGELVIIADENALLHIIWLKGKQPIPDAKAVKAHQHEILHNTQQQLDEYFNGERQDFDLPIKHTGTDFQLQVWQALSDIPYGETISYKELAEAINNPGAVRAVGGANGKNAISIVVPCHRVIAADRSIGGYAGGLNSKQSLLTLENSVKPKSHLQSQLF